MKLCKPSLLEDIRRLQPRLIVCLGGKAAQSLLGSEAVAAKRNKVFTVLGCPTIVTYHPAFVMRRMDLTKRGEKCMEFDLFSLDMDRAAAMVRNEETKAVPPDPIWSDTLADVLSCIDEAEASGYVAFDYETTGLDAFSFSRSSRSDFTSNSPQWRHFFASTWTGSKHCGQGR